MTKHLHIFAIYTWEDNNVLLHVLNHLKPILKEYDYTIFQQDPIQSGKHWTPQNLDHFANTDLYLLFLSNTFMHSQFIQQLEFKNVIDSYKENKSKVIPILVDDCPWNTDFKSDDYNFNFNELVVLPSEAKPIENWHSPEHAFKNITTGVAKIISSFDGLKKTKSNIENEIIALNTQSKNYNKSNFAEERAVPRKHDTDQGLNDETEVKKREEGQRLQAQAAMKRKAEVEQRQLAVKATRRRVEVERARFEKAEANKKNKQEQILQQDKLKADIDQMSNSQVHNNNETNSRNRLLIGTILVLLIFGLWFFWRTDSSAADQNSTLYENKTPIRTDLIDRENAKVDSVKLEAESFSKLIVGETYKGGIIFSVDASSKKIKVVHSKDAGPMPWSKAIKINEQLGNGWRLPTFEELVLMYKSVGQGATNTGQFANELYWSSTEFDTYQARLVRFSNGNSTYHYNKSVEHRKFKVRAVRDFKL